MKDRPLHVHTEVASQVAKPRLCDGMGQRGRPARIDIRSLVESADRRQAPEYGSTRREERCVVREFSFDEPLVNGTTCRPRSSASN
jgi:hypothetical protein